MADRELGSVPLPVRHHIEACQQCAVEVRWQYEAGRALEAALSATPFTVRATRLRRSRRGWAPGLGALAAAAALLVIAGTTGGHGPTPGARRASAEVAMGDAALAYGRPAAFTSTDSAAIAGWSAGRGTPVEVMSLAGERPTGARVSSISGHEFITVIYSGAGVSMEVTVVPGAMTAGWPVMEANGIDARAVGLVHRYADGVLLVTPDPAALHSAMTILQAV